MDDAGPRLRGPVGTRRAPAPPGPPRPTSMSKGGATALAGPTMGLTCRKSPMPAIAPSPRSWAPCSANASATCRRGARSEASVSSLASLRGSRSRITRTRVRQLGLDRPAAAGLDAPLANARVVAGIAAVLRPRAHLILEELLVRRPREVGRERGRPSKRGVPRVPAHRDQPVLLEALAAVDTDRLAHQVPRGRREQEGHRGGDLGLGPEPCRGAAASSRRRSCVAPRPGRS